MDVIPITSTQNPTVKAAVKLRDKRARDRSGLTLLEGYRELSRAHEYGMTLTEVFFCPEQFLGVNEYSLLETLAASGCRMYRVPDFILTKMAYRERPEGLIAAARVRQHPLSALPLRENPLFLVAEAVEKPGNLGSMLRSADAAGADGFILCDPDTDIYNPNVIRASTGAVFSVPLAVCTSAEAIAFLRAHGIAIYSSTPHTDTLHSSVDMTAGTALVVGTEQVGLTDTWLEAADVKIRIPMLGKIDSLNVATAATLLLYEAARQRNWRIHG